MIKLKTGPDNPSSPAHESAPTAKPNRRAALARLMSLTGTASAIAACGGGGDGGAASISLTPASTGTTPPPAPSGAASSPGTTTTPATVTSPSVARLKSALANGREPSTLARPVVVTQGPSNVTQPSLGSAVQLFPVPRGADVRPNPVTLADMPQAWAFRGSLWERGTPTLAWAPGGSSSWYVPMNVLHRASTMTSGAFCSLHFRFDGSAFEVLYAGTDPLAVLIVDGLHATPRYINRSQSGGFLTNYDTYVRYDFGSRAARNIALHCKSTLGPQAIAIAAGDTLQAWDRSGEPSMSAQADSYGQSFSAAWGPGGLFLEAAERLGIPHVDTDAIGGTGYAPNNGNADTRNPGNAFPARLAGLTRVAPDIFIAAGGINDNDSLAAPPLYETAGAARLAFDTAVAQYFRQLRSALPDTVLVALGPWQPKADYFPETARRKADTIKAALQAVAGPWIFVDNLNGGWLSSTGGRSSGSGVGWQTGTGTTAAPKGDGNGDQFLSAEGTHPNEAGVSHLAGLLASSLRQAIATL